MHNNNPPEENDLCLDLVSGESHFKFVKMHVLSHFCDHIPQFDNILMYSTKIRELAQKSEIQDGWCQSNKNNAAHPIIHSYPIPHAIRMRLLNLESLKCGNADLSGDILHHLDWMARTVTAAAPVVCRKVLKGPEEHVSNFMDFRSQESHWRLYIMN